MPTPSRPVVFWVLLAVFVFFQLSANAQQSISSGQTVTGVVADGQVATLDIAGLIPGVRACLSVRALSPNANFSLAIALDEDRFGAAGYYDGLVCNNVSKAEPTKISIKNALNPRTPGSYPFAVELTVSAAPYAPSSRGGLAYSGVSYNGTLVAWDGDIWSFSAAQNDKISLTLGGSAVSQHYFPIMYVYKPDGSFLIGYQDVGTKLPFTVPSTGTYLVIIRNNKQPNGASFDYTFSLSGSSLQAAEPKTDGGVSDGAKATPTQDAVCSCFQGDPVNVATGNLFEQVVDYSTVGGNRLAFVRYFNSFSQQHKLYPTALGPNWRSNFDRYLRFLSPTLVTAERPSGQVLNFFLRSGVWTPDSDVDLRLAQSGSIWTLTDANDTAETYTVAGELGTLNSVKTRNGYTQNLAYRDSQLATVTDSYSRSLSFSYAGGVLNTVTTPDSLALSYGYTKTAYADLYDASASLLTSVSYNSNPTVRQSYLYEDTEQPFFLTGITDENGNRYATWTYDSYGRATSSQHAGGADLTNISYDDTTGNRTVTNPLGQQATYVFATVQSVPKVMAISRKEPQSSTVSMRSFTYDNSGYLNSQNDWNGNLTTYVNNGHGQPTTINEAVGTSAARTTTVAYDSTWVHLPQTITTPGLTTNFTYDAAGNPLTRTLTDTTTRSSPYGTNGQKRTWTYSWSNFLLASVKGPRTDVNATKKFAYGSDGALTSVQDALGHVTKITAHSGGGLPQTVIDPNGVTTSLVYDQRLNLQTSTVGTSTGKLVTSYSHDAANNLTAVQLPDGSKLTYGHDAAHRLTSTTDRLGNSMAYTLDALGDQTLVQVKNAANSVTLQHSATFDALGRKLHDIGGMGQLTAYTYDGYGNLLTVAPPSPSGTITYSYDALNRLATAKDPTAGGTTTRAYDAHDRLLSVKDANGHTTSYVYDGFGDRIQTASPDSGSTVYRYDTAGNPVQTVRPGPLTRNATYDALDRPLAVTYPSDSALNVLRSYDQAGHGFGIGRLTSAKDQVGTLSLTYDERGNVTNESRAVTGAATLSTTTMYDMVDRVSGIRYPSGTVVAYGRDAMGRVTSIMAGAPGATTSSTVVAGVTYEPFGPETALTFGNAIKGTYSYDLDYQPTGRTDSGGAAVQKLAYVYFPDDNVKTITDGVNGRNSQSFGYDALDRLTSATSGAGGYGKQTFAFDPVGNVTSRLVDGITTTFSYAPGTNRLSKAQDAGTSAETVGMTAAGNLNTVSMDGMTMETAAYNQANQLASIVTNQSAAYGYDLYGQRLKKTLPGTYPILYQFSRTGGELLSENDLHKGQAADYIYLNGRPISEINPVTGQLYFTHTDRLGTPQKLTDSAQNVAWSALYEPFGSTGMTVTGTLLTQSLRLPGQQFDPESGLNHNGFRDYSPDLGRYIENDPIGLVGGPNIYVYASGNPVKFTDRMGLDDHDLYINGGRPIFPLSSSEPSGFDQTSSSEQILEGSFNVVDSFSTAVSTVSVAQASSKCAVHSNASGGNVLNAISDITGALENIETDLNAFREKPIDIPALSTINVGFGLNSFLQHTNFSNGLDLFKTFLSFDSGIGEVIATYDLGKEAFSVHPAY